MELRLEGASYGGNYQSGERAGQREQKCSQLGEERSESGLLTKLTEAASDVLSPKLHSFAKFYNYVLRKVSPGISPLSVLTSIFSTLQRRVCFKKQNYFLDGVQ